MHKFSIAATKSSALAALRSVGLLNVPYSTFAGASDPQAGAPALARSALSSLRDKNLCIIRACGQPQGTLARLFVCSLICSYDVDEPTFVASILKLDGPIDLSEESIVLSQAHV